MQLFLFRAPSPALTPNKGRPARGLSKEDEYPNNTDTLSHAAHAGPSSEPSAL